MLLTEITVCHFRINGLQSGNVLFKKWQTKPVSPDRRPTYITKVLLLPFNGLFSRTTWVSRYQKGKTNPGQRVVKRVCVCILLGNIPAGGNSRHTVHPRGP